jgi:hypothetical protein
MVFAGTTAQPRGQKDARRLVVSIYDFRRQVCALPRAFFAAAGRVKED